jgi:hypothetical protein
MPSLLRWVTLRSPDHAFTRGMSLTMLVFTSSHTFQLSRPLARWIQPNLDCCDMMSLRERSAKACDAWRLARDFGVSHETVRAIAMRVTQGVA